MLFTAPHRTSKLCGSDASEFDMSTSKWPQLSVSGAALHILSGNYCESRCVSRTAWREFEPNLVDIGSLEFKLYWRRTVFGATRWRNSLDLKLSQCIHEIELHWNHLQTWSVFWKSVRLCPAPCAL